MPNLKSASSLSLLNPHIGSRTFLTILGVMAASAVTAHAQFITPLTITGGFNQDVIADGTSAASSTTATVDGFANFYDASYASYRGFSGGDFPAGQTVTGVSSGVQYTLAPASSTGSVNDDLLLAASDAAYPAGAVGSATAGTLSFAPLADVETLYVLGMSTNGGSTLDYQLNFAGGATSTGTISYADWGSGAPGGDVTGLGRVITSNPAAYSTSGVQLYDDSISVPTVDQSLTLTGITFTYASGDGSSSTASIFAVSAVQAVPEPSTFALMAAGLAGLAFLVRRKGNFFTSRS